MLIIKKSSPNHVGALDGTDLRFYGPYPSTVCHGSRTGPMHHCISNSSIGKLLIIYIEQWQHLVWLTHTHSDILSIEVGLCH